MPADLEVDLNSSTEELAAAYDRRGVDGLPREQAAERMRQLLLLAQPPRRRTSRPTLAALRRQGLGVRTAHAIRRHRSSRLVAAVPPSRSRRRRTAGCRCRGSRRATGSRAGPGDPDGGDDDGDGLAPGRRRAQYGGRR